MNFSIDTMIDNAFADRDNTVDMYDDSLAESTDSLLAHKADRDARTMSAMGNRKMADAFRSKARYHRRMVEEKAA